MSRGNRNSHSERRESSGTGSNHTKWSCFNQILDCFWECNQSGDDEGQQEWLFYSDYYEAIIDYCLQDKEKEWIHRWIEFHITSRRLSEARKLIEFCGWDGSVKEYVEKILRVNRSASDLLCYVDIE